MCFEVLGFDIYIDDQLKPYVLEVNHTPSFSTDSVLDAKIKKNVIKDALVLLNLSVKNKRDEINERRELMYQRVITGKNIKINSEERIAIIKRF